jgi:uncharacterized membrane protein YoaK (UPF0700 family)
MRHTILAALLSFNAGFVDTAGFLGLQGLFTAHVTGNFVTLAAVFVLGTQGGAINKVLALPEFVLAVALTRVAGVVLTRRRMPTLSLLLSAEVTLLLLFFALGVGFGPFPDSDVPLALLAGCAGVAAMALQNAVQRVHFPGTPPTTIMTSNTTQAVLDGVDLLRGGGSAQVKTRFEITFRSIAWFAAGCALAASLYYLAGFWSLAVPVAIGAAIVLQSMKHDPEGGPRPQHAG